MAVPRAELDSHRIDFSDIETGERIPPVHPGEILREEFMMPFGLSANNLGKRLGVPSTRIGEIIHGKRSVTADTALRLGRLFGMSAQFWLNLQAAYDLETAERGSGKAIEREVNPLQTA